MTAFGVPVEFFMSSPAHTIASSALLKTAAHRLEELRISSLAVVTDDGELVGVITRTDLLRAGELPTEGQARLPLLTLPEIPVAELASRNVITIGAHDTVARAASLMIENHVHRVFVVEEKKVTGVFSTKDLMTVIWHRRVKAPLTEFMSTPVMTIESEENIAAATAKLEKAHVTGLVVIHRQEVVGVYTQLEALRSRKMPPETHLEHVMGHGFVCLPERTPLFRASAQASTVGVRRVIALKRKRVAGILSGLDFARVAVEMG